ncbi:MAG: hypothetical protein ACKV2O_22345 [Acidimicrobiales bacterium]
MSELVEFYERYIDAFNRGDQEAFVSFFHLPVTMVHGPGYDQRRAGKPLVVLTEAERLLAPLPGHWVRSTIDAVVPLDDAFPFEAREGLVERHEHRAGILATVTRWHQDGAPYEHLHVLYLLTRENGKLGIKTLVELASARRPTDG